MPLAMQQDFGTISHRLAQPGEELGITFDRRGAVPVGHDEQRGHDVGVPAQLPEPTHRSEVGWGHIVNRDEQDHRRSSPSYTSKMRSNTRSQLCSRSA